MTKPSEMTNAKLAAALRANWLTSGAEYEEVITRLRAMPETPRSADDVALRDYFAGEALSGILSGGFADTIPHDDVSAGHDAAFFAYIYADAMIEERIK